tara:strand:- start:877 stop:1587 length:711 start_codon:yes stop_codon:yes gene_type:complete
MLAQEKNIKGFNVLEVIVVLAIVGIITAVAYPKISHWNAQRQVDTAATKIKTLFTNINAQIQRGNYGFVQVYFSPGIQNLTVLTRGMTQSTLAQKVSNGEFQNATSTEKCDLDGDFWDDDGRSSRKPEVGYLELEKVITDVDLGAICFSKDGRWYSASTNFLDNNSPISSLYICEKKAGSCLTDGGDLKEMCVNVEKEDGVPKADCMNYLYLVSWSRFGNIRLEKYNGRTDEWINQ